jgi:hypothetical protein
MIDTLDISIIPERTKKDIINKYRGLLRACRNCGGRAENEKIKKAFTIALNAHL